MGRTLPFRGGISGGHVNWGQKFKNALDISEDTTKKYYDELAVIRRRLRNYVAHGAFGKDGQAFSFHSTAGAVPLLLPHQRTKQSFQFGSGADLEPGEALGAFTRFEQHLWSGKREGAKRYVQDLSLPLILTMADDGTYNSAYDRAGGLDELAERISHEMDRAMNMDW